MRGVLGTIAIYFINGGLATLGISLGVGINAVTVLTSGFLGIPGLLALYGLGIYQMLWNSPKIIFFNFTPCKYENKRI